MKLLLLLSVFLFSSCSFNSIFLHPDAVPPGAKGIIMNANSETIFVSFDPDSHQPVFLTSGKDTMMFDYTIESVVFESSGGNKLNGWFIKPKGIIPLATLLHFHGNAGWVLSQYQALVPLLKYGFQIFTFDYSGYGFSEGKATRKDVLKDGNSAVTYVKTREDVKNIPLVIYGQSLGGHLSGVVAAQRRNEIDALVIEGAFSSHKDIAGYQAGFMGRLIVSELYSAIDSIKAFNKPVLVIHSTEDATVPFELGKKLFDSAGPRKEFYEIKNYHIRGPKYYGDSIAAKIFRMIDTETTGIN